METETAFMRVKGYILGTAIFLLASGFFLSCEDLGNLLNDPQTSIDTEYYEMDFSIQPGDRGGFHIFAEELFSTEINNSLNEAGFAEYQIESVILKEAQINLLEAENIKDFGILQFLELTVYTDSLGESKIAWSNPVPAEQSTISLDITEDNILPYFNEDTFVITAQGYLKERVYENVNLHARVKFQVWVKL